ncbi:hypothetical protein IFM89_021328 [Coptis chinensis]|uniref:Uncharacterized protein n=1 Tax=Coptis chinensis TaxID=261450 RepID=A0A835HX51_9MAGN|nr:hypothetical protein IFM89_021328 [Coptis chinensis]
MIRFAGKTPLILASLGGHMGTALYLLDQGANPNTTDDAGFTPLHYVAERGPFPLPSFLFQLIWRLGANIMFFPLSIKLMYAICTFAARFILSHWFDPPGGVYYCKISLLHRTFVKENFFQIEVKAEQSFKEAKLKGEEAFSRNDYLVAIFWYNKAISANPLDKFLLSKRSLCWALTREGDKALDDARKCLEWDPEWAEAHYREGVAWSTLKKYDRAVAAFRQGIDLDPNDKELKVAFQLSFFFFFFFFI